MVVFAGAGRIRVLSLVRFGILALACVLVAHTSIFIARHGTGPALAQAMSTEGHDAYWPAFLIVVGGGVLALVAHGAVLLASLARPRPRRHRSADGRPLPGYWAELLVLWPKLLATATVLYALQENLEHEAMFGHMPGLGVLWGPEGSFALPGLLLATLLGAAVGALVRWRIHVLRARVGAPRSPQPRHRPGAKRAGRRWAIVGAVCAHAWILVRSDAGRAPPVPVRS
jgi:hypothetical protein